MSRKEFRAPVWWLVIMGIIAAVASIQTLYVWTVRGVQIGMLVKGSLFYLPLIMFVEAVMYWTIRKRIHHRRDAWSHIIIFTGAYVLSFVARFAMGVILVMHMPVMLQIRTMSYVQIYLFWGLVIVAHVFFARVLLRAFARPPVMEGVESGNLLDDVLD